MSSGSITSTSRSSQTPPIDAMTADFADDPQAGVLAVTAAGVRYGIPVRQVREVVRPDRMTPVPGAPSLVWGIVNVRGAVVTVLDLAVLLGAPRGAAWGSVVLLEQGNRCIGLAVDTVLDVRGGDAPDGVTPDGAQPETATRDLVLVPLDAVVLCARHLHITEEMAP